MDIFDLLSTFIMLLIMFTAIFFLAVTMFRFFFPSKKKKIEDQEYLYFHKESFQFRDQDNREIADHVNRLTKIAKDYGQSQQLREHISREVNQFIFSHIGKRKQS